MSRLQVVVPGDGLNDQLTTHGTQSTNYSVDVNPAIASYNVRPGAVYFSPARVLNYVKGLISPAYWIGEHGLLTTDFFQVSAPGNTQATYQNAQTYQSGQVTGYGQAPTSGVYTGIPEEHC